jgi:hypothetical protein
VDVFDAADVETLVDADAAPQRLAVDVADIVAAGRLAAQVQPLVRVEQQAIDHGDVFAGGGDAPRVRGDLVGFLLGVEDGDAAERGVGAEADERRSRFGAGTFDGEQRRAQALGPGGRRSPDPFERDGGGNV